jgi:hypothetical protein
MASKSKKKAIAAKKAIERKHHSSTRVAMLLMLDNVLVNVLNLQNSNVP